MPAATGGTAVSGGNWWTDPVTGTAAILLTNQMWIQPAAPPLFEDFWRLAFGGSTLS